MTMFLWDGILIIIQRLKPDSGPEVFGRLDLEQPGQNYALSP